MKILYDIDRLWGGLLWLLMACAAIYIGLMMVGTIYYSIFRFFGWSYNLYVFPFIEYGFLYCLFLGSPWMIRHRGHVYIEMLTAAIGDRARNWLSRLIALICCVSCLTWAWYTWGMFTDRLGDEMAFDELRAQLEIKSWVAMISFPLGFLLMGFEFARFVVLREPMHLGEAGVASDRTELEETKRSLREGG